MLGPSRVSDSDASGLELCISREFQVAAETGVMGLHFESHWSRWPIASFSSKI